MRLTPPERIRSEHLPHEHQQPAEQKTNCRRRLSFSTPDDKMATHSSTNPDQQCQQQHNIFLCRQPQTSNGGINEIPTTNREREQNRDETDGIGHSVGQILLQCGVGNKITNTQDDNKQESISSSNSSTKSTSPMVKRRRRMDPEPGTTTREGEYSAWTFIIHKSNTTTMDSTNNARGPQFLRFDHGDHWHIIFTSSSRGQNVAKQRSRICGALSFAGPQSRKTADFGLNFSFTLEGGLSGIRMCRVGGGGYF